MLPACSADYIILRLNNNGILMNPAYMILKVRLVKKTCSSWDEMIDQMKNHMCIYMYLKSLKEASKLINIFGPCI